MKVYTIHRKTDNKYYKSRMNWGSKRFFSEEQLIGVLEFLFNSCEELVITTYNIEENSEINANSYENFINKFNRNMKMTKIIDGIDEKDY